MRSSFLPRQAFANGSPTTVLPVIRRSSKAQSRKSNGKPKSGDLILSDNGHFTEIRFDSCKKSNQEDVEMLKWGSAHQSSDEVMQLRISDAAPERKKIEFSGGIERMSSFGIIDSLCNSDDDALITDQDRLSVLSCSDQSTSSSCNEHTMTSESVAANLHKPLVVKFGLPQSPVKPKTGGSKSNSPNFQFSSGRKILDPFVGSKTQKSPLSRVSETCSDAISANLGHCSGNGTLHEGALNVSLDKQHHVGFEKKENNVSGPLSSPAYLHGFLKLKIKRGVPFFKFSVKFPEEIYTASTSKVDNTLNWTYTIHSVNHKRSSNPVGWRLKDSNRDLPIVGQMLVSCYLSTELKVDGASSDSMVTEFFLYDNLSLSCSFDDNKSPLASHKPFSWSSEQNKLSMKPKNKAQVQHSSDSGQLVSSASQLPTTAKLPAGIEIAAILIQVPFEKRESLKFKSGDMKSDTLQRRLVDFYQLDNADETNSAVKSPGKIHVVIPAGRHGLPTPESLGPSPLLDRWRSGGKCECSGWDLGCPLTVFSNANVRVVEGQSVVGNQHPAELFHEGRKDEVAFSMRVMEEGNYAVDFHARLSSLQAFSICIALLHAAVGRDNKLLQSKVYPDKGTENFADVIVEEHSHAPNKIMEGVVPSFVVNPVFSPIGRV
ncbi:uncharacterized protein LOC127255532 isoform X2 [Andrographis paniculata]|uniref:uncharacterized protein LOC127255532 isoform X2 n=1 Tax=Andrographis paniculata TaxID=175694 RepID=UPI0021E9ADF6|nr:uncharacterized protein LOC127255532 isoform X2 [Andrographis paniculata]